MLPTTTRKQQYAISYPFNTDFTFDFKFWAASQVSAILSFDDGVTADQVLAPTVDYSLSAPGDSGTLTRLTDWNHAAVRITIVRTIPLTQDTDYRNGEAVDMDLELERDFDLTAARDQQLAETQSRVVTIPITDPAATMELPSAGARRGLLLGFDSTPEAGIIPVVGMSGVVTTAAAAEVLDDMTHSEMLSTLGVSDFMIEVLAELDAPAARLRLGAGVQEWPILPGASLAAGLAATLDDNGFVRRYRQGVFDASYRNGTPQAYRAAALDDTHLVLFYLVPGTGHWWALVVTVNFTANPWTFTYGTPVDSAVASSSPLQSAACALDSTHVLWINTNAANTQFSAQVISVSGTTATWNGAVALVETPHVSCYTLDVQNVDATHAIVTYSTSAPATRAVFITVTGTAPAWGASVLLVAQYQYGFSKLFLNPANAIGVMSFIRGGSPTIIDTAVFDWAGVTITLRSTASVTDAASNTDKPLGAISPNPGGPSEVVVVAFKTVAGGMYAEAIEGAIKSNHTGLTLVPEIQARRKIAVIPAFGSNTSDIIWINDRIGVIVAPGPNAATTAYMFVTRLGSKILAASKWHYTNLLAVSLEQACLVPWKSNLAITALGSTANNGSVIGVIEVGWDRVVGIAANAAGRIVRDGYLSGLSGLIPLADYYIQADGTIGTTPTECKAGLALSATEMDVNIQSLV